MRDWGKWEWLLMGMGFLESNENILELIVVIAAQYCIH